MIWLCPCADCEAKRSKHRSMTPEMKRDAVRVLAILFLGAALLWLTLEWSPFSLRRDIDDLRARVEKLEAGK